MKQILLMISLISIIFSSCEKINLQTADSNVAVIESYINPSNQIEVKVTKQIVFQSDETEIIYLDNLDLKIKYNDNWLNLDYKYDSVYTTEGIDVKPGDVLELAFEYNDKTISSETVVPAKPQDFHLSTTVVEVSSASSGPGPGSGTMEPVVITWTNPNNEYHMIVVKNIESNPDLINDDDSRPVRSFRNSPVQGESQDLSPRSFVYYGQHQVILFRLNPEYAALYENLESNSLDISAPPTNITNGLGIFTGFNADTLYLNVVPAK